MEYAETTLRIDAPHRYVAEVTGWQVRAGLHLHEVETLLDGLEASGCDDREIQLEIDGTFLVRWRAA